MNAGAPEPELTPIKRALIEIRELRGRLAELERASGEPIAIVGMGVRAPGGVRDVEGLANLLWAGVDAIGTIPADRWPLDRWFDEDQDAPGKMSTRFGGFIDEVDRFDAEFFGISPREAESMDPQQRLVLELAWHALEDAGHAPAELAGSRAGVYLGIANGDYGRALFAHPELIDPYFSPGNAYSVAAGRLSYILGLHGPAISLDTACSSSLVALHLACQGLRLGECDLALAGGVNLILTPEMNVNFSKAGMLARDGRCKTFDAAADGYVRGEGGGMLVLKRLRDAQADGDRILAVVAGSAVNQDGRSNGLTAPNGPAQEAVIRAALKSAKVAPALVGYVEAHGTGTSLGDPIEVNALGAVLSEGRDPARPLKIGSIKTNIGHLEAAAGVLGVIKAVLALGKGETPPHLNFAEPNPLIDWDALPVTVPTRATALEPIEGRRVVGVSSFGFSGTNAHVIVEAAPEPSPSPATGLAPRPLNVLALSARDPDALAELAAKYEAVLRAWPADRDVADLCFTANAGRSHFAHRLAVSGAEAADLAEALAAARRGEIHPNATAGVAGAAAPRAAFLFPGQGPQHVGMGRGLYEAAPVFRAAFDRVSDILDALLPQPIRPVVFGEAGAGASLDETAFAQPAMFAIEVALAALWRSWGVEPAAVLGHSFGEYAAAWVAGAVSLEDAARMVVARGRLTQDLPRDGAMTVLEASEADVREILARRGGRVAIAAVNGPTNTVISGERAAVEAATAEIAGRGARVKALRVSHAFHSPLVDPVLGAFEAEIAGARFAEPEIALVSSSRAQLADLALIGQPAYWRDHMRQPVLFAAAMKTLAGQGVSHYVEMSPHPVLLGMAAESVEGGTWLASLRQGAEPWSELLASLRALYCAGAEIDWAGFDHGLGRRRVAAPTYPFRRKRHWLDAIGSASASSTASSSAQAWGRLADAMDRQAERGPLHLNATSYPAKYDCLARLTAAYATQTLREAGVFTTPGERRTVDQVLGAAGIGAAYRHLLHRWLETLSEQGLLRADGEAFVAEAPLPEPPLASLWTEAEALFADNQPLLAYVRHCATLVGPVLTGRESPLETLFPGGSFDLAEGLYERSTTMLYVNQLAGAALEAVGAATPVGGALRVLEIGAGTGGTTSSLLKILPPERTRYRFTDVSEVFLDRARDRFAAYPFVDFGLFDLDADLAPQGYAPGSFDVIVSANAVHAVKDLRAALGRIRTLLAPGGVLVLVESTTHLAYFDMTTGLIEGWQHFADDLRQDNPLLPPATWTALLQEAGFAEAKAWPPEGSPAEALGQHVIAARAPGEATARALSTREAAPAVTAPRASSEAAAAELWLAQLTEAAPSERLELLRELVRSQVMQVLRLDPGSPPARHDRLMDLGMDSLMAVQLRNGLNRALNLDRPLPSTLMFDYPTIDAIAAHLQDRLIPAEPARPSRTPEKRVAAPSLKAAEVEAMSDDEIEALLMARLETGKL